jgi:hypothetical protein
MHRLDEASIRQAFAMGRCLSSENSNVQCCENRWVALRHGYSRDLLRQSRSTGNSVAPRTLVPVPGTGGLNAPQSVGVNLPPSRTLYPPLSTFYAIPWGKQIHACADSTANIG